MMHVCSVYHWEMLFANVSFVQIIIMGSPMNVYVMMCVCVGILLLQYRYIR